MTRLWKSGLAAAALLVCAAPATAVASTRVGIASGTGANAGEAIRITGDRTIAGPNGWKLRSRARPSASSRRRSAGATGR